MENKTSRIGFLVLLLLLMAAFIFIIQPFLVPALIAMIFTVICWPINCGCSRLLRGRRYPAALLATIIVSIWIIVPLSIIFSIAGAKAVGQIKSAVSPDSITAAMDHTNAWLQAKMAIFPQLIPEDFDFKSKLVQALSSMGSVLYEYSPKVLTATAGFFAGFLLVILFMFLFFAEGILLRNTLMDLLPLEQEHKDVILQEVGGVITGTFIGMAATALAQGILIGIGYWIAGVSNPLLWGTVAVGVTLIPVIGGPIMYVSPAVALIVGGSTGKGIFLLIWGVALVSTIDNIIKPVVMRGKVNVHPVLLALAIIGGSMWLGAVGFIVGPVIVALMLAMVRIYRRELPKGLLG